MPIHYPHIEKNMLLYPLKEFAVQNDKYPRRGAKIDMHVQKMTWLYIPFFSRHQKEALSPLMKAFIL